MARKLYPGLVIPVLISGCAMTTDPKPQTEQPPPSSVTLSEKQVDLISPVGFVESNPVQAGQPEPSTETIPSRDEIQFLQARMKVVGFDPGPVDGVMGPKTKTALRRFQSACDSINDLLESAGMEGFQKMTDSPAAKENVVANGNPAKSKTSSQGEIQLLQARMKTAGFDPGPIDGIMGPKTRAQLVAAQSGCALLKKLPGILNQELQTLEQQAPPVLVSKRPTQPTSSATATPAVSINKQPGQSNTGRKHWLVPMKSN